MDGDVGLEQAEEILKGFRLPPRPHVFAELKKASPDIAKMSVVVEHDQALSASILKVVNSPAIGLKSKVTSVNHAMSLLGMKSFMNIINAAFLKQTLSTYNESEDLSVYWDASNKVAIAMAAIANELNFNKHKITADEAYCVGMFHNVGIPMLLDKHGDYLVNVKPVVQQNAGSITEIENHFYSSNHTVLGFYMTKGWGLPKELSEVIKIHHNLTVFEDLYQLEEKVAMLLCALKMAEITAGEAEDLYETRINHEWAAISDSVIQFLGMSIDDFFDVQDVVYDVIQDEFNKI